jgi:hypothetical protein
MQNKDHIETAILVLNDVLSDISIMSADNGDIFADEIVEINNQITTMQKKLAHKDHDVIGSACTVCDYAGHDRMIEELW